MGGWQYFRAKRQRLKSMCNSKQFLQEPSGDYI